jgi:hypothetical protein
MRREPVVADRDAQAGEQEHPYEEAEIHPAHPALQGEDYGGHYPSPGQTEDQEQRE